MSEYGPEFEDGWRQDDSVKWTADIFLKDGSRLEIIFERRSWTLDGSSVRKSRAVLGDTDDYVIPYGDTYEILISTRRRKVAPAETHNRASLESINYVIRLDLHPIPLGRLQML